MTAATPDEKNPILTVDVALQDDGLDVKLVNNQYDFLRFGSRFRLSVADRSVYWRSDPTAMVGLKLEFMESATKSGENECLLAVSFACPTSADVEDDNIVIYVEFSSTEDATEVMECLMAHKEKWRESNRRQNANHDQSFMNTSMFMQNELVSSQMDTFEFRSVVRQEKLMQFNDALSRKESVVTIGSKFLHSASSRCQEAFSKWTLFVRDANNEYMHCDRGRWRLHAAANQETDLQAWYHSTFHKEVYRLRGPFWFKDAVMPLYKQKYDIVDQGLTPLEEAALAHVLCSPETTYGDVAGQMFVVQAIVSDLQFALFQELSARGANVTKCPRSGRPAKKLFRFSFVEGNIYLTWKGKYGNQGVDLGEVRSVERGVVTDVTMRLDPTKADADKYLSLLCEGRSVDLRFEFKAERDAWYGLLDLLVKKENGKLISVPSCLSPDSDMLDALLHGAAVGSTSLTPEMRTRARDNRLRAEAEASSQE